jgi:hypothetical protein
MQLSDKELIEHGEVWPGEGDFLFMTRGNLPNREHGFLVAGDTTTVRLGNLWACSSIPEEKICYPSIDAMLADGWCVD